MKVAFNNKKDQDPTRVKGLRIPYASARRTVSQWRWYLILLVVASPLLYLIWKILMPYIMVTAQGYLSLDMVPVNSTASGIVEQIHVELGERIVQGQIAVTLYNPDLLERRRILNAEKESLSQRPVLISGSSETALRQAVRLYQDQVAYQESLQRDIQFLYDMGAATIAELNQAKSQLGRAKTDLISAQKDLALIKNRQRQEQDRPDQDLLARKKRLDAELSAVEDQLLRLFQVIKKEGRVLDIFIVVGEAISLGAPMFSIAQVQKPYAVVYLDPRHIRYAKKGNFATIRLPDGQKINAMVKEDAALTRRIPADISSPVSARDIMLFLKMDLLDPLPLTRNINGLPVFVQFKRTGK